MKKLDIDEILNKLEDRFKDDKFTTLKDMPTPELLKDMDKATKRIVQALKDDETINIIGDYDADGVNSTAIMVEFFNKALGVEVNYIIPNRFEHGYGISEKILDLIYDGIIITVDNGISAVVPADICKQRGLDLIITDHHTVSNKIPDAYAIINPKQEDCLFPFEDICGANVAWYLCASLKRELNLDYNLLELFDFLTIAVVADIMPMVGLNKTIVKKGLQLLSCSTKPFAIALRQKLSLNSINEEDIGFKIAPLINCAGRMEDASLALDFLLSYDLPEALEHIEYLIQLNENRKKEQLDIFEDAKIQVDNNNDEVIVVSSNSWNEGIIGIVASKLCDRYKKPSFVFSINKDIAKASARSVGDINLYDLITEVKDNVLGYGGHKGAAGLSVKTDNLEPFKCSINKALKDIPIDKKVIKDNIFCELSLSNVDENLYNIIQRFRPFGLDNKLPIFYFKDIKVLDISYMGKNKEYKKIIVSDGFTTVELVVFIDIEAIYVNDFINFTATIGKNEFKNNTTYNLMLKDIL